MNTQSCVPQSCVPQTNAKQANSEVPTRALSLKFLFVQKENKIIKLNIELNTHNPNPNSIHMIHSGKLICNERMNPNKNIFSLYADINIRNF